MGRPVVLVTGAARGLGFATSQALVRRGYHVLVADLPNVDKTSAVDQLGGPDVASWLDCDVRSTSQIGEAIAYVERRFRRLDAVVNNAGIVNPSATHLVDDRDWEGLLDIHLTGTLRVSRASFPLLAAARSASIVNVSSVCARRGFPARASYNAAKAAIEALTRTLAVEWGPVGIRVNALAPGFILTENARRLYEEGIADREARESLVPLGRMGRPDEVGEAAAWLSADARYVTGHVLVVDGGYLVDGRTGPDPNVPGAEALQAAARQEDAR